MINVDTSDEKQKFDYTFESGEHMGESYEFQFRVCANPLCRCDEIHLTLTPTANDNSDQQNAFEVSLDLRNVAQADTTKGTFNRKFAESLVNDFSESDWEVLRTLYFHDKVYHTETANLTSLEVTFPLDEIEETALLISYNQVFPYNRAIWLQLDDYTYFVDDLYCLRSDCHCHDVHLFFEATKGGATIIKDTADSRKQHYVILNLQSKRWTLKEQGDGPASAGALMAKLFAENKPIQFYSERHKILRSLYKKYRSKTSNGNQATPHIKVERNDPCPCGSGKKYEKCCMPKSV